MNKERTTILGVPFDNVRHGEALTIALESIAAPRKHPFFIATPNPEMILAARKDFIFREILKNTDLNIPDGIGIILASKLMDNPLKERVTGTDLMQSICEHAPEGTKIFLLGAAPGIAEKTKTTLERKNPNILIVGCYSGSPDREEEKNICSRINDSGAQILFVAFGAPKQEFWISKNIHLLHHVKLAMGVGGAFDFIAGEIRRAPEWMRGMGLEWLFRLIKQPSRIRRIFNATIVFPVLFLISRLKEIEL